MEKKVLSAILQTKELLQDVEEEEGEEKAVEETQPLALPFLSSQRCDCAAPRFTKAHAR